MHSHRRPRAGILFEALCAFTIAASFVLASMQTGASAFLGCASVFALLGLYWSTGLFARDAVAAAVAPTAETEQPEVAATRPSAIAAEHDEALAERQVEIVADEADVLIDPEPLPKAPAKRRARKARAAKAGAGPAIEPTVEPTHAAPVYEPAPSGPPIEQLFDPQPFVKQIRPAFGRRARGSKPLSA